MTRPEFTLTLIGNLAEYGPNITLPPKHHDLDTATIWTLHLNVGYPANVEPVATALVTSKLSEVGSDSVLTGDVVGGDSFIEWSEPYDPTNPHRHNEAAALHVYFRAPDVEAARAFAAVIATVAPCPWKPFTLTTGGDWSVQDNPPPADFEHNPKHDEAEEPTGMDLLREEWRGEVLSYRTILGFGEWLATKADPSDKDTLDSIANLLGAEWDGDTLDEVADLVRRTGRDINDSDEDDEEPDFSGPTLRQHFQGDHEIEPLLDEVTDVQLAAVVPLVLSSWANLDPTDEGEFHLAACQVVRAAHGMKEG